MGQWNIPDYYLHWNWCGIFHCAIRAGRHMPVTIFHIVTYCGISLEYSTAAWALGQTWRSGIFHTITLIGIGVEYSTAPLALCGTCQLQYSTLLPAVELVRNIPPYVLLWVLEYKSMPDTAGTGCCPYLDPGLRASARRQPQGPDHPIPVRGVVQPLNVQDWLQTSPGERAGTTRCVGILKEMGAEAVHTDPHEYPVMLSPSEVSSVVYLQHGWFTPRAGTPDFYWIDTMWDKL